MSAPQANRYVWTWARTPTYRSLGRKPHLAHALGLKRIWMKTKRWNEWRRLERTHTVRWFIFAERLWSFSRCGTLLSMQFSRYIIFSSGRSIFSNRCLSNIENRQFMGKKAARLRSKWIGNAVTIFGFDYNKNVIENFHEIQSDFDPLLWVEYTKLLTKKNVDRFDWAILLETRHNVQHFIWHNNFRIAKQTRSFMMILFF